MNSHDTSPAPSLIERVRQEPKRRTLTVTATERLTPGMLRITFESADLADFASFSPDDHIKIFLPGADGKPEMRDYTPRRYDNAARTLVIDFAVHDAGPVTAWAMAARPGDRLEIGGPRGSAVVSSVVGKWLLIGDETALPAIGRRIEETKAGNRITSLVAVAGPDERQTFETAAELDARWCYRPLSQATVADGLIAMLTDIEITDDTFVWIAAEAGVTRAIRNYITETRGHPLPWLKAAGYWVFGKADASEKF
jgi:NADPH-dependent ferric siderophore reductase